MESPLLILSFISFVQKFSWREKKIKLLPPFPLETRFPARYGGLSQKHGISHCQKKKQHIAHARVHACVHATVHKSVLSETPRSTCCIHV